MTHVYTFVPVHKGKTYRVTLHPILLPVPPFRADYHVASVTHPDTPYGYTEVSGWLMEPLDHNDERAPCADETFHWFAATRELSLRLDPDGTDRQLWVSFGNLELIEVNRPD